MTLDIISLLLEEVGNQELKDHISSLFSRYGDYRPSPADIAARIPHFPALDFQTSGSSDQPYQDTKNLLCLYADADTIRELLRQGILEEIYPELLNAMPWKKSIANMANDEIILQLNLGKLTLPEANRYNQKFQDTIRGASPEIIDDIARLINKDMVSLDLCSLKKDFKQHVIDQYSAEVLAQLMCSAIIFKQRTFIASSSPLHVPPVQAMAFIKFAKDIVDHRPEVKNILIDSAAPSVLAIAVMEGVLNRVKVFERRADIEEAFKHEIGKASIDDLAQHLGSTITFVDLEHRADFMSVWRQDEAFRVGWIKKASVKQLAEVEAGSPLITLDKIERVQRARLERAHAIQSKGRESLPCFETDLVKIFEDVIKNPQRIKDVTDSMVRMAIQHKEWFQGTDIEEDMKALFQDQDSEVWEGVSEEVLTLIEGLGWIQSDDEELTSDDEATTPGQASGEYVESQSIFPNNEDVDNEWGCFWDHAPRDICAQVKGARNKEALLPSVLNGVFNVFNHKESERLIRYGVFDESCGYLADALQDLLENCEFTKDLNIQLEALESNVSDAFKQYISGREVSEICSKVASIAVNVLELAVKNGIDDRARAQLLERVACLDSVGALKGINSERVSSPSLSYRRDY